MNEQLKESLSALVDGEAQAIEVRRILAHKDKAAVDELWRGFHRTQTAINGRCDNLMQLDISSQVSRAIADERVTASKVGAESMWLKPLGGLAVAASVMFAVVLGVQSFNTATPNAVPSATELAASRAYPVAAGGSGLGGVAVSANAGAAVLPGSHAAADYEARQRLERYMLRHTEHAALNNGQGLISYARVARFDVE